VLTDPERQVWGDRGAEPGADAAPGGLVRSKRALAILAALAVGLGLVGADAAVADPKPAAAPAPPLDPTPTNSDEIPNLGLVKNQIKFYYGDPTSTGVASPSSPYAREVRRDETRLRTWLAAHRHGPKKPALVLDVDDTALLTYNYEISEDFGFNPTTNAEFVLAQRFPAVFGMVATVSWATQHGYTLFFVTGRPDTQQDATEGNLAKVGYPTPKQVFTRDRTVPIPAYLTCQATCTTVQYKSLTRKHIESLGYRIVANVGDQFSDLQGDHEQRAFKLPNPMYFIP
jgi:HAD superfamily, subfamily IIIB (Acid phosphatase)